MAGIKISQLPAVGAPLLTDIAPEVQPASGGTTYQMTWAQLLALFQPNIPLTFAGNPNGNVAGTVYQFLYDTTDGTLYVCTTTGSTSTAVWTSVGGSGAFLPLSGGTMSGNIAMGTHAITGMANPVNAQDAATKNYVDTIATGGGAPVVCATTANLNATYSNGVSGVGATLTDASGTFAAFSVDGQSPSVGARILVKNQSSTLQNGVYTLTRNGDGISIPYQITRATDYDTASDINDTGVIPVSAGTVNANTGWINTTIMVTVGTTAVTFVQFGISAPVVVANGGTGLTTTTAYGVITGGTTATGNFQNAGTGATGTVLQGNGSAALPTWSTATYPTTATGTGSILRADGTNWSATTTTYPNTNAINTIMYASSANVLGVITPVNSAVLTSSAGGVPSWNTSLPAGTGINATMVLKSGTNNASSYTTTSTSFTAVDGTNLSYTVTIPTGSKLLIAASGNFGNQTANDSVTVAVLDGASVLQAVTNSNVNTTNQPFSLNTIITGDGASHTIQLQWAVNAGTGYMFNSNVAGQGVSKMTFLMLPSS